MKLSGKRQRGVSLIEALIALIVLSLGMLGQVAFMVTAMRDGQQARYRAIASYYAEEMISLAISDTGNRAKYVVSTSTCTDATWAPCTGWLTRLKTDLPQSSDATPISVTLDSTTSSADYGQMTVTIQWKGADGSSAQTYVSTTNLNLINQ